MRPLVEYIWETLVKGGWVMVPLILTSWLGWHIVLRRFFTLRRLSFGRRRQPLRRAAEAGEWIETFTRRDRCSLLGGLLAKVHAARHQGREGMEAALDEFLKFQIPVLEKGSNTLAILASAAPLMGLLGTVVGMVKTFEVIGLFGTGNQSLMADAIAEALMATQNGLLVAFPLMILHIMLHNAAEKLEREALADGQTLINLFAGSEGSLPAAGKIPERSYA